MSLSSEKKKATVLRCLSRSAEARNVLNQAQKNNAYLEVRHFEMYLILTDMDFLRVAYLGRTFLPTCPLKKVNVIPGSTDCRYILIEQPFDPSDPYTIRESLNTDGLPLSVRPTPLPMQEVWHHAVNHPYGPYAGIIALVDSDGKMLVIDPGGYGGDCVKPILLYDGPHRFRPDTVQGNLLADMGNQVIFVDRIDVDQILLEAEKRDKAIRPGIERFSNCWSLLWYTPGGSFRTHADASEMLLTMIREMFKAPDLGKPVDDLFARLANVK